MAMDEGHLPKILSIFLNDDGKLKRVTYVLKMSDSGTLAQVILDLRNLLGVGARKQESMEEREKVRWQLCDLNRKTVKTKDELYFQPASTFQLKKCLVNEVDQNRRAIKNRGVKKAIDDQSIEKSDHDSNRSLIKQEKKSINGNLEVKKSSSNQEAKKSMNGDQCKSIKNSDQGTNHLEPQDDHTQDNGQLPLPLRAVHQSGPNTPSDNQGIKLSISKIDYRKAKYRSIRKGWMLGKSTLRYQPAKNLRAKKTAAIVKEESEKSVKETPNSVKEEPKNTAMEIIGIRASGQRSLTKNNSWSGNGSVKETDGLESVKEDHVITKASPKSDGDDVEHRETQTDMDAVENQKLPAPEVSQVTLCQKPPLVDTVQFFDKFGEPMPGSKSSYAPMNMLDRRNNMPLNSWYIPLRTEAVVKKEDDGGKAKSGEPETVQMTSQTTVNENLLRKPATRRAKQTKKATPKIAITVAKSK